MRKSSTFEPRLCEACGEAYVPSGSMQRFCNSCGEIKRKEVKRKYYLKKFPNAKPKTKSTEICCICGDKFSSHFDGKPYCNKHYLRMLANGTPEIVGRKPTTTYAINGDVVTGTTSSGRTFTIDLCDFDAARKYSWCFSKTGYLVANIGGKVTKLHRYLLSPDKSQTIDHINGDPSDNRRENLRICSPRQNSRNAKKKGQNTIVTGVTRKSNGKYRVRIMVDRKEISIGTFNTEVEAISARKAAEIKYFGDYSPMLSRRTSTLGESE